MRPIRTDLQALHSEHVPRQFFAQAAMLSDLETLEFLNINLLISHYLILPLSLPTHYHFQLPLLLIQKSQSFLPYPVLEESKEKIGK